MKTRYLCCPSRSSVKTLTNSVQIGKTSACVLRNLSKGLLWCANLQSLGASRSPYLSQVEVTETLSKTEEIYKG